MTTRLEQAFAIAATRPTEEQERLATRILAELEDEFDRKIMATSDKIATLAAEALAEDRAGLTLPLPGSYDRAEASATRPGEWPTISEVDNLWPEYDAATLGQGVRGKYLKRYHSGTNLALLAPYVRAAFPTDEAVNRALREVIAARGA